MNRILLALSLGLFALPYCKAQENNTIVNTLNTRLNAVAAKVIFLDYGMMNPELEEMKISNGLEVAYIHHLNRWFNFAAPAKIGLTNFHGNLSRTTVFSLDALLQIQYYNGKNKLIPYIFSGGGVVFENWKDSNLQLPVGIGINFELGKNSYLNLQAEYRKSMVETRDNMQYGLGYKVLFSPSSKKFSLNENRKKGDIDGDNVPDNKDNCPDTYGLIEMAGCPDSDNDGIIDSKDDCPNQAGSVENLGCPDTDKDGIADIDDDCPNLPGPLSTLGCPDSDGDGLADNDDECPTIAGKKRYNGCPKDINDMTAADYNNVEEEAITQEEAHVIVEEKQEEIPVVETNIIPEEIIEPTPVIEEKQEEVTEVITKIISEENLAPKVADTDDADNDGFKNDVDECPFAKGSVLGCPDTDNDGVHDGIDDCPNEKGTTETSGCPVKNFIVDEDLVLLNNAVEEVQFEDKSSVLLESSYEILDKLVETMARYPNFRLIVEGHTDNIGNDRQNLILSEDRARVCYEYLTEHGVNPVNIQYTGYGQLHPIADNKSKKGRERNQRIQFVLEMK